MHVLGNTFTSDPPLPSLESVRCGPSYWTVPDPLFLSKTCSGHHNSHATEFYPPSRQIFCVLPLYHLSVVLQP